MEEKCDYCGKIKKVIIIQSGLTLKDDINGLELENKIRDFINGGKRKENKITLMPVLCEECYREIMKILLKR